MDTIEIIFLYEYNYWANQRILTAVQRLSLEQFTEPYPLSHGSLRGTLVHILAAEVVWRQRCQEGISPKSLPLENDFPDLQALLTHWQVEEQAMRTFLQTLTDDDLHNPLQYQNTRGQPFTNTLWHLLVHVVIHGTQFRSEAALALTVYGYSPGDLDMLLFWREKGV